MDRLSITIIFGSALLILTSCSRQNDTSFCYPESKDKWTVCDTERGYAFWYPHWIEEGNEITKLVEVYTYNLAQNSPCTQDKLGNPDFQTLENTGGETVWTKMLHLNVYDAYRDPYCSLQWNETCTQKEKVEGTCTNNPETYVLCSQKDEKIVAICLQMQKDNPALAEEIFGTFTWKE